MKTAVALPRRSPGSPRRRAPEIIEAAARVFAERGYHGASTQDIADVLGIRQASLYYYFPSKEVALEVVCTLGVEEFVDREAEVAAGLEAEYPAEHRELVSFVSGDAQDLATKLRALLELSPDERRRLGAAARRAVVANWSWASVAERLLEPVS